MGARTWMLLYSDGDISKILRSKPELDRVAAGELASRLYDGDSPTPADDGTMLEDVNPPEGKLFVGVYPGLTVVCSSEIAGDYPSKLDRRFINSSPSSTVYLHAMHSVVDWFAYAVWKNGKLERALSLSPDSGILENIGQPMPFEVEYWDKKHAVESEQGESEYPFPFHPLDLGEAMLRANFGFNYEGKCYDDDPALEDIVLAGFNVQRRSWLSKLAGWFK